MKAKRIFIILAMIMSVSGFAWYGIKTNLGNNSQLVKQKSTSYQSISSNQLPKDIKLELEKISNAQLSLNQYHLTNITQINVPEVDDFEIETDTIEIYRSDKNLALKQDELLKLQTKEIGLFIDKDQQLMVLMEPDEYYFDMLKNYNKYFSLDSLNLHISRSSIESIQQGEKILYIEFSEGALFNMKIYYDASNHTIKKIIKEKRFYEDESETEPIKVVQTTWLNYKPLDKKTAADFFDINKFYSYKKGKYMPKNAYKDFQFHNNTYKAIKKNLN